MDQRRSVRPVGKDFRDMTAEEQIAVINREERRIRNGALVSNLDWAIREQARVLKRIGRVPDEIASLIARVRRHADEIAEHYRRLLSNLPSFYGGNKRTKKEIRVTCTACNGAGALTVRQPIVRRVRCLTCEGKGTFIKVSQPAAPRKEGSQFPKKLSKVQRSILVIALAVMDGLPRSSLTRIARGTPRPEDLPYVPTKTIRSKLRIYEIAVTDAGFSRSLQRLEQHRLIVRYRQNSSDSRPTAPKTSLIRLTRRGIRAARAFQANG
jgi:hypothetical protein